MIKVKVTDEMIQAAVETAVPVGSYEEARAVIEAALAIVERDLNRTPNARLVGYCNGSIQYIGSIGCIEVDQ